MIQKFLVEHVFHGFIGFYHRTPKLALFQEWMEGLKQFVVFWYKFKKAKSYFNMDGYGQKWGGLLVHETLKLAVSEEWIDELSRLFACG